MRNFFLFIIRNYAIILFLLLEIFSFWLIFNNNAYQKTWFLNTANNVTGDVLNTYGNLTQYFYLKNVNDSLLAENAKLRSEIKQSIQLDTSNIYTINDSTGTILYTYIPAEVIYNSYTAVNNYITLNRGSKHGIEKNMGVITSNGICGKIITVSENFSVVMSVLHSDFFTRTAVKKNNAEGRLIWRVGDPTTATMVDVSEPGLLLEGDTIITSASSQIFPSGIMIGKLKEYSRDEGSNFYNLQIKLSTQFSKLRYVYVVNYVHKNEQQKVEEEAKINAGN